MGNWALQRVLPQLMVQVGIIMGADEIHQCTTKLFHFRQLFFTAFLVMRKRRGNGCMDKVIPYQQSKAKFGVGWL